MTREHYKPFNADVLNVKEHIWMCVGYKWVDGIEADIAELSPDCVVEKI
jgi:hypothetical protein